MKNMTNNETLLATLDRKAAREYPVGSVHAMVRVDDPSDAIAYRIRITRHAPARYGRIEVYAERI